MACAEDFDNTDSDELRQKISKAREEKDVEALQIVFNFLDQTRDSPQRVSSPDIHVLCAEAALQLGREQISKPCLKMYFEGNPPSNQFLCRAYLCQGQLECPPATGSTEDFEKAVDYFLKAIEVAKQEPRNHCLVFNASVLYFHSVRPLLQWGRSCHLVPSLRQVIQSLEEVNDPDHSWRAQLMMQLIKCYVDEGEMEKAVSFAKVTEDFMKSHTPQLFPELFSLMIQHKLSDRDVLLEMSQKSPTLTAIYKLAEIRNSMAANGDELKEEDASKLQDIFDLLVSTKEPLSSTESNPRPLPPAVRVAFLLELALLALQTKHQKAAADCLKELKTAEEASPGQRIIIECISCEISLLKKEAKMNEYSKSGVEARLREIGRLDQWLLNAERLGDPQAIQTLCASLWRLCLPLLQHNLRRRIRSALLRVAQALEDIQSLLLETRCQVHSELALIEEEEGRLEAALTHLHKALQLDPDGTHRERLSSWSRLLQLRALHTAPSRPEDKAATLMQQLPMKMSVLDAAELRAKAQHHYNSVQMINEHLNRQEDADPTERLRLWAALAKTSRKLEEWDVCRAACRFCLLYDDGRWKLSKANTEKMKDPEAAGRTSKSGTPAEKTEDCNRELLRLLAEIHFINAEAVVQKLHTEGVQLNCHPVPPLVKKQPVSEDDADWIVYRDWMASLSAYASSGFSRAAELGAEISESWVVANAAVYLWNYNKHSLSQKLYRLLLPSFRPVVELMQKMKYTGDRALFAMLCNAVARGLIQPLSAPVSRQTPVPVDRGRGRGGASSVSGLDLDPGTLQDARKALELCDFALKMSSSSIPGELVPIAVRSQIVSTWVQTKRVLQQQISSALDVGDESNAEERAMTRVLVGLEMFQCNGSPGQMDFSLPALSTLVALARECSWTDAAVELQVWCQLSTFCHGADDHGLALSCTQRALSLEESAAKRLGAAPYVCKSTRMFSDSAVNEMLSRVSCLRGLSLAHESYGDVDDGVSLKAAVYRLLLQIHIDKLDLKSAKQLLEKAQIDMPRGEHKLSLLKSLICIKARLGDSVAMEMQKLETEGERCCSSMWHQVALCSEDLNKKLTCYRRAIDTLTNAESRWQKVCLLLELSEWMFFNNFPQTDALHMVQWAIDLLLQPHPDESTNSASILQNNTFPEEQVEKVTDIKDVKCLDALVRAHVLLAVMAGRISPEYQPNLLRAYCFVRQMWEVSITEAGHISSEMAKFQAQSVSPASAGSKKGKDKDKEKDKDKGKVKKPKEISPDEDKLKSLLSELTLPQTLMDWVCFHCPDQARFIFKNNSSLRCLNTRSISKQSQSLFYLDLLVKQLASVSLPHLTLPVLHLAETIAHDLLDRKALSELYRLRIVKTCCELRVETHSPYQEKLHSLVRMHQQELIGCKKAMLISQERKSLGSTYKQRSESESHRDAQNIWLDKAEVCLSMGLHTHTRLFLEQTHSAATDEFADELTVSRSLRCLAALACEQQSFAQALMLLDRAQASGGDHDHWYQLTQTRIQATARQREEHAQTKIDHSVKQGCEALQLIKEKQVNRSQDIDFMVTSLKMRGAVECIGLVDAVEPGRILRREAALRLQSDCDELKKCAQDFLLLQHREEAAEALAHCSHGLRFLAEHTADTEQKQRLLLDALAQMQAAVHELEHVALNSQNLLPAQEESPAVSLAVLRWLLRLRLTLCDLCLFVLELHCTEHRQKALDRTNKSPAQILLEDFTRSTPEPHSVQQAWLNVGTTLGQEALGQLAAVNSHYLSSEDTKARSLCLMGKYLRLQATMEDPIYVSALWDPHKQSALKKALNNPQAAGVEQETSEQQQESSVNKTTITSSKSSDQQLNAERAQDLLAEASKSLSEASGVCLQNQLSPELLSEVCLNMVETHGLSDPCVTGQYLALLQRLPGLLSLLSAPAPHKPAPVSRPEPHQPLQATQATVCPVSKAFSHLSINPSHLTILSELPPNLKLLLLQHSEDRKELYGAFYEVKAQGNQKVKTTQTKGLTCSKVAKISVCPRTLLTLLDRIQTLGQETRRVRLRQAPRRVAEGESGSCREGSAAQALDPLFRELLRQMEAYLNPLLSHFDFSGFRPVAAAVEPTRTKDKEEKTSSATFPAESGESLVLLADQTLLLFPLEALSVLQEDGLTSVSRDFCLQLLHRRLTDAEKGTALSTETKGAKAKGDQSQAIKARTFVLPPNTVAVNSKNIKYLVDPYNDGVFDGTSLSRRMRETLETHSQLSAHLWEGLTGSKHRPSAGHLALETPLHTALLLSLGGVGCVALNQWHSSFHLNTRNMAAVLDGLLKDKQTSGQVIHSLRKEPIHSPQSPKEKIVSSHDHKPSPADYSCVLYGLPNLIVL
ncbi:hypothetical protein WMY93_018153 [Mugilogobius chulae]|uniref:Cilia- and flagella-associated protein 46 n=1 Tax=Mugilogobius chulae TaxID=88201 RepID=A0AAW0NMA0_9GOBI